METNRLRTNLLEVQQRIQAAAERAGRSPADVELVAVTKYVDSAATRAILEAGCQLLGESRPQQLWSKAAGLSDLDPQWHLIGHLQRNKVDRSLPHCQLVHSVDSQRLLAAINEASQKQNRTTAILLEVNISGDASKHGWPPAELAAVLEEAHQLENIQVQGLMTMAALGSGTSQATRNFSELKSLFDQSKADSPEHFKHLSMGMSGDFEIAIEQGATLVRVGSALWDGVC